MTSSTVRGLALSLVTGLLYAVLVAAVFWPLATGRAVLFAGDIAQHYLPWEHFASAELSRGVLPELHRGFYCGHPLLAEGQAALLYPVTRLVYALVGGGSLASDVWAFQLDVLLHWIIAGWGIWYAATILGLPWRSAFIAGLLGCFAGLYLVLPVNVPILRVAVWTGWLIGTGTLVLRSGERSAWLANALLWGLCFLAGGPQMTVLVMVGCAIYLLCSLIDLRESPQPWLSVAGLMAAPLVGGFLAAAQLLPTWLLYQQSAIRQFAGEEALSYSATWLSLSTFLVPPTWLTGLPPAHPLPAYVPPSLWIGTLGAVLAILGTLSALAPARLRIWLGTLLIFALGSTTPVYPLLVKALPFLGWFRAPDRYLAIAIVPLCLLAGWGLEHLLRSRSEPEAVRPISPLAIAGGGLAVLLATHIALLVWAMRQDPAVGMAEATWSLVRAMGPSCAVQMLVLSLFAGTLHGYAAGKLTATSLVATSLMMTMLQLLAVKGGIPPLHTLPRSTFIAEPAVSAAIHAEVERGEASHWGRIVHNAPFEQAARLFGPMEARDAASGQLLTDYLSWHHGAGEEAAQLARLRQMHPNAGTLWGQSYVGGIASLYTARIDQYLSFMENTQLTQMFFTETRPFATTLLDLAGGRYLLVPDRPRKGFLPSVEIEGQIVAINNRAKPLAWLMQPQQLLPESPEALTSLVETRLDPGQVLVLDSVAEPRQGQAPDPVLPPATWSWHNANTLQIEVEPMSDAWLIVGMQALEGWTGELNGRRIPLHRAWGTFLAVPVKAGPQRLTLDYRTPGLDAGIPISIGTLMLLTLGMLWWSPVGDWVRSRLPAPPDASADEE